jgi:hypothetical protein
MGKGCLILGWGTTLSAPLSSQLAAVLAGFVFTSIVFLISREGRTHSRALGLFCAAFVVLGFDSHLFAVLSGSVNDPFCGRVWTQAVTASGLLGTGAMAIITGIIWLLPNQSHMRGSRSRRWFAVQQSSGMTARTRSSSRSALARLELQIAPTTARMDAGFDPGLREWQR